MDIILKYLSVFAVSALKYMFGVVMSVGFEFNPFEMFFTTAFGGIIGVAVFSFFGFRIRRYFIRRFLHYFKKRRKNEKKPTIIDTLVKKVWGNFGIFGLALITPPILGPVLGTSLAVGFGVPRKQIIFYMGASLVFWSVLFSMTGNVKISQFF